MTEQDGQDVLCWVWRQLWLKEPPSRQWGRTPQMDHWQDVCHAPHRFPGSQKYHGTYWKRG